MHDVAWGQRNLHDDEYLASNSAGSGAGCGGDDDGGEGGDGGDGDGSGGVLGLDSSEFLPPSQRSSYHEGEEPEEKE